ncbi:PREDICTED: apoptotic protease-activating factor 1 isoform X1 [Polistes canadensis]|uniref:apoptotic protease-activating factor 1 isoform X1 n=1 Tax=Polistes canadensis TaxID=91411 RepID=UPI000718BC3B|nr:PREDICTED: apoptotic protease-activating factor 1 isoform X1 [Polistes canadensis]XP_014606548.1 PREDICTED: apoptotic protease-activating factor 1 isoform X1 [Polistes canadensis]
MEKFHQDILNELREQILADMDVRNGVLPVLSAKYILKQEDVKYIETGISLRDKAELLLEILPNRGVNAFNAFRESLRHHYGWLSADMDDLELKKTGRNSAESLIIPPTSPLTIIRDDKIKQLVEALNKLNPDGYLTLHGMKGFGRSCLTASTLNNTKLAEELFHNKIYWLKFGYDKRCKYKYDDKYSYEKFIEEEITKQLSGLYYRITNKELLSESLNSELFKIFLLNHFSKKENRNALLVLEDVYDKSFIEAFDFKCKTLVITTDLDVLDGRRGIVIKMDDGFTEAETLGLFAKVLDTSVDQLPFEAKLIHKECKGMPLLIAMFSANFEEFKHDMNKRNDRWQYYLKCIQNKDRKNTIINKFLEKQETVFNMSIERLPPHLKTCYEQLAIFSEDVNITSKTLEILWSHNLFEVEEMMLELCHKSLAVMKWNANLDCYIYGVHDLLLCHLRRKLGINKLTEMHKMFIEKYRKYCNNDFSKLPDDNYSYSYIGHHLELAKLYNEFPTLYLDFNFLEAKLNHTGLCDLLIDFNKYKKYIITNDNESNNKVNDLEKFFQEQASNISKHKRKKCLDLIQIAMNHFRSGYVVDTATSIAEKRINNLYLSQNTKLQQNNITESEEVCTETYTTCFTDDPDVILIGNKIGEVIQWHSEHKKQIVYKVCKKECIIEKIVVSKNGEFFLTLCNRIVKFFKLYSNDYYNKFDTNIQSPKQKQAFWDSLYSIDGHNCLKTFSIENETIKDVAFGHDDKRIAACTDKGIIQVWDIHGNILTSVKHKNNHLGYITFTTKSSLLHTMDLSNDTLVTFRKDNNEYSYNSQYNLQLSKQKVIFFHNVPKHDNSLIIITEKKAIHVKWFCPPTDYISNYEKKAKAENDKTIYVCASITYDGLYLVLADSEGLVNVWKIDGGFHPIAVYKSRVASLDTYWLNKEGYHYICGNENNLVHKWKFPVEEASDAQVRNLLFDALVKPLGEEDLIAKTTNVNSIVVLSENNVIAELNSIDGDIISLKLSPNGNKLVYVTKQSKNEMAILLDIESKTTTNILKVTGGGGKFIKFLTIENDEVIIFRETNDTLRVWKNNKISYLIDNTGPIISIHDVHNEYVITVAQNGVIILYNISGTKWTIISKAMVDSTIVNIYFSCFSHRRQFLALLNNNQDLFLYNLQEDDTVTPRRIVIELYYNQSFKEKPTYCDISQDQKYLAIGFKTGSIAIIDIEEQRVLRTLYFHTSAITQLNWAPVTTEAPLLLSLNGDELAWWNVQLTDHSTQQIRRSRYGLVRSISTPSASTFNNNNIDVSSLHISNSSTGILEKYEELNKTEYLSSYWKCKVGRDGKKPELLGALELTPSCIPKVCISADFSKFVTVDIYGSVSTFKLFDYLHVK